MTLLSEFPQRHRSIRRYRPDPVPYQFIDDISADALAGASSFGNLNNVSIVLTYGVTSTLAHRLPVAPNLLDRRFDG